VVAPGHSAKVLLDLSAKGVAPLRKSQHPSVHVTTTFSVPGLTPVKSTHTITITQPKPNKHSKKH
jgi:hypothetical protein